MCFVGMIAHEEIDAHDSAPLVCLVWYVCDVVSIPSCMLCTCLIQTPIVLPRDLYALFRGVHDSGIVPGTTVLGLASTASAVQADITSVPWSHGPMVVYHGLASTYAPLGIKCSVCLFGATEPEGSHSIKLPRVRHAPPDTAWQRFFKHTICAAQTNFLTIASGLCDKAPVSISMSFCFSRTACIAAFGTRKCEVKSCQFWRNFLGSLSYLNASKLITPLIYLY